MIALLRQRNYGLLWFAGAASMLGDYAMLVALPFFIYDLTGSALVVDAAGEHLALMGEERLEQPAFLRRQVEHQPADSERALRDLEHEIPAAQHVGLGLARHRRPLALRRGGCGRTTGRTSATTSRAAPPPT